MKITFQGVVLAEEASFGGGDGLDAPLLKLNTTLQVAPLTRASAPKIFDRGNRSFEVGFTIHFAPLSGTGEAMIAIINFLLDIPTGTGVLVLQELKSDGSTATTTFANAGLKPCGMPYWIGASWALDMVFVAVTPALS